MARTLKSKASTGPRAVKRRRTWKASRTAVDSTKLIEIGPDHPFAWTGGSPTVDIAGAIVKLVPPPGTPEDVVTKLERMFYEAGAASVKTMPVAEEVKVTVEGETFDFGEGEDTRSLRQVVMDRADRTTNSQDIAALKALLEKAMDQAEASA